MKAKPFIQALALLLIIGVTTSSARTAASNDVTQVDHLISLQYGVIDTRLEEPPMPSHLRLDGYLPGEPGYYLVQFRGVILSEWKSELHAVGAKELGYVPYNAFIVRMTPEQMSLVVGLKSVQWVGVYQPAYRIAPWLPSQGYGEAVLTVLTFPGVDLEQIENQLLVWNGQILAAFTNEFMGYVRVSIDSNHVSDIARINGVMWIEPWVPPQLSNDVARSIMDVDDTVWSVQGLYGADQIIAIADTGLDVGRDDASLSDDFEGRIVSAYARGRANDWSDPNGHGTHVAGSALGNGRNSGSNPGPHSYGGSHAGIAPEAGLVFQSILAADGSLNGIPDQLATLFQQAYDDGARVHSNSWGSHADGNYDADAFQTDQFCWTHPDMVVLFAAGNRGVDQDGNGVVDLDSIDSPGTAKNVITVGATESERTGGGYNPQGSCDTWGSCWSTQFPSNPIHDDRLSSNRDGMAAFSSRGPVDGNRVKPDLVAPGTNILSTRTHQYTLSMDAESGPQGWTAQGTWAITTTLTHNGTHSWTTGPYGDNQNISLTATVSDIRTEADTITFWTRYDLGAGDHGRVEYFNSGDAQWHPCNLLNTQDNSVTISGSQDQWIFVLCPLPVWELTSSAKQNFRIRFRLTSDASQRGNGWFIDDILVTSAGWGFDWQASGANPHYMYMGGTSMATPLVAGASALVREYYTRRGHEPSAALVRVTLVNGAGNITPGQYGTGNTQEIPNTWPNNVAGWGRVNIQQSLFPPVPQVMLFHDVANAQGLDTNQAHVYRYEVRDRSVAFRASLAWTDFPGLPPAGNPRITHDLDLLVQLPNGSLRYPNGRTNPDSDNNVEDIFLPVPDVIVGTYVITVTGRSIPDNGPQGYALVVRGGGLQEAPRIAVNPAGYDDIGAVLTQMGSPWVQIQDADIAQYERIRQYQTVFANCSNTARSTGPSAANSLRRFVQDGGSFYASDWAYTYVSSAFSGSISFRSAPLIGNSQLVNARVVDPGLANYLDPANPPATIQLNYNLGGWAVIDDVASGTRVHLRGSFTTSAGQMNDKPLAVSFSPYTNSSGRVIYTTFHNEAQQSALEKKLLEYLVLVPSTSRLAAQAEQVVTSNGLYVKQTNINTLNPGGNSAMFSYNVRATTRLMFVSNWEGSTLRLSVYRPDGTLYSHVESGAPPIVLDIPSAAPGMWRYQVTAVLVPYANYPYVVVIGDQFPSSETGRQYLPVIQSAFGLWHSSAGITGRIVYDIASANASCSTLIAGTNNGAYRSLDGGQTWSPLSVASQGATLQRRPFDGQADPDSNLTPAVAVCPANPDVVYLTRWGEGVYRSTDGGASWQPRNGGLNDFWIYDLAIHPSDCDVVYVATNATGVFKTSDGGSHWQARNGGLGNLNGRSLAIAPSDPNRLYVGTASGVYRSDNGGGGWNATGWLPGVTAWALAVTPGDASTVTVGLDGYGVYKSTSGGSTWQAQNTGLGNVKVRALVVDPSSAQTVYVGRDDGGGVYRSLNGASSWTEINQGLGGRNVKTLWLDGGSCRTLHAGTTNGAWYYER